MNTNKWTLALAAVGLVSLPTYTPAEEKLTPVQTALASTVISGYVNVAAQWNPGTGNANPPAFVYNSPNKQDAFSLNVVDLTLAKPLDEGKWSAGYKVELWLGQDANTFGSQSPSATAGDFAVRQAYVALRAPLGNGLDFKLGAFDTILGYEVHDAGSNPNYTRSYGYTIEPVSHTGLLASYKFTDALSANVGVANTHGPKINENANPPKAESYKTYMGSLALTAPQDWGFLAGSTLYGGVINGFSGTVVPGGENMTSWYAGATVGTPIKELKTGVAFDYSDIHGGGYAWSIGGYASFQATDKLSLHGRGEYLQHSDGDFTFLPTKVVEVTATVQYDLWANVLARVEFRWDHSADGTEAYGGSSPGEPTLKNSYLLAANFIYKF